MQNCELYIGDPQAPAFYFNNAQELTADKSRAGLISTDGTTTVDLVGSELSIDLMEPVVHYVWHAQRALKPTDYDGLQTTDGFILCGYWNDSPADIEYATPIWYYVDGELSGKFYFDHAEEIGRNMWMIHGVSAIGLLDLQTHRGGVYTGKTVAEVLVEFFGGTIGSSSNGMTPITGGIADCYVQDSVAVTTVHGLLPYASKRANLHQLIFSYIINVGKNGNGDLVFSYLALSANPPRIPDERIYLGGKIDYQQPVTDVELTEYTYVYDETVAAEKIYDNSTAPHTEGEALVIFDKPIDPDTIYTSEPTMIVRDANETSAYVTGHGIIYAVPYQIQERVLNRSLDKQGVRQSVSVSNVTLVNPLNSSNLMDKLFEFYTTRQTVTASVKVANEKAGELYSFTSPYGDEMVGFISKMNWHASAITKADCEIITNYAPTGVSTNMQNVILLTGSGVWTVPSAIRERDNPFIRAVIIQGGTGGHGGYPGEDSKRRPDSPGAGGAGGEGGEGGKVLTVDIDVTNIEVINYYCGDGGEGGESGKAGSEGGETTFGDYSSAAGAHVPGGIMNIIDGKFYARSGSAGYAGAAGGEGATSSGSTPTESELAAYGANGKSLTVKDKTWAGGKGGRTTNASTGGYFGWAFGGGGAGAAHGAKGGNGTDGHVEWQAVIGGFGGSGATATTPGDDAQSIGCGGNGGHGGGGGGAPGNSGFSGGTASVGYVGEGGKGSKGGKGAPGGILIYY